MRTASGQRGVPPALSSVATGRLVDVRAASASHRGAEAETAQAACACSENRMARIMRARYCHVRERATLKPCRRDIREGSDDCTGVPGTARGDASSSHHGNDKKLHGRGGCLRLRALSVARPLVPVTNQTRRVPARPTLASWPRQDGNSGEPAHATATLSNSQYRTLGFVTRRRSASRCPGRADAGLRLS